MGQVSAPASMTMAKITKLGSCPKILDISNQINGFNKSIF